MITRTKQLLLLFITVFFLASLLSAGAAYAVIATDCFVCHKYSGNGRYDDTGHRRIFYVNAPLYKKSAHGAVKCGKCHSDINELPHKGKKNVDCSIDCHLTVNSDKLPGGKTDNYSHKSIAARLAKSVHNKETNRSGKKRVYPDDVPSCNNCHTNTERGKLNKKNIVELCLGCHSDVDNMNRNKVREINAFEDSFHLDELRDDNPYVPDCIDCHASDRESGHDIQSMRDSDEIRGLNIPIKNSKARFRVICGQSACHDASISKNSDQFVHSVEVETVITADGEKIKKEAGLFDRIKGFFSKKEPKKKKVTGKKRSEISEKVRVLKDIKTHFHQTTMSIFIDAKDPPLCLECHGNLPHTKAENMRSLLNMHTYFFACEICHKRVKGKEGVFFAWIDFNTKEKAFSLKNAPDDYNAKLVPIMRSEETGIERRLDVPLDEAFAREFLKKGYTWTMEQRAKAKAIVHEGLNYKPVLCDECHKPFEYYLPLDDIDYPQDRIDQITIDAEEFAKKFLEGYEPSIFDKSKSRKHR